MERGSLVEDLSTNTHFFFFLNFLPEVYIGTYIHKLGVLLHRQIIGGVENDTQNYTYPCIYIYIDIRLLYIYIYIYSSSFPFLLKGLYIVNFIDAIYGASIGFYVICDVREIFIPTLEWG
jgi:hypothetical protein